MRNHVINICRYFAMNQGHFKSSTLDGLKLGSGLDYDVYKDKQTNKQFLYTEAGILAMCFYFTPFALTYQTN